MISDHAYNVQIDVTLMLLFAPFAAAGIWLLGRAVDSALKFLRDWC